MSETGPRARQSATHPGAVEVQRPDGTWTPPVAPSVIQASAPSFLEAVRGAMAPPAQAPAQTLTASLPGTSIGQAAQASPSADPAIMEQLRSNARGEVQRVAGEEIQAASLVGHRESEQSPGQVAAPSQGQSLAASLQSPAGRAELAAMALQRPRGGRGGPRTQQVTTFQEAGRAPTEAEAAQLGALGESIAGADRASDESRQRAGYAEAEGSLGMSDRLAEVDRALIDQQERQRQAQRLRASELRRREGELERMTREVASRQISPASLFQNASTGARISAAIGIGLSGLGAAMRQAETGAPQTNAAMSIINQAIERDLQAQAENLSNARASLGDKRGILAEMRRTFGDDEAAEQAARAGLLASAERQLESMRLSANGQAQIAAVDGMLADIRGQRMRAQQAALIGGLGTTETTIERRSGGGRGGRRGPSISELQEAADFVGGPQAEVSREERTQLADRLASADRGLSEVDRALSLLEQTSLVGRVGGRFSGATEQGRELERTLARIADAGAKATTRGVLTDADLERYQSSNALSITTQPDELRASLARIRRDLTTASENARLSVGQGANVERDIRAPDTRRRTAHETGRPQDIISSFEPG